MKQRDRKGSGFYTPLSVDGRPQPLRPPPNLPENERKTWISIVSSLDPGHFHPSDAPLLRRYCEAINLCRRATAELELAPLTEEGRPSPWLVVQEKQDRAMQSLSARLRLCPQSRAGDRKTPEGPKASFYDRITLELNAAEDAAHGQTQDS